jgi:hypothetical protein
MVQFEARSDGDEFDVRLHGRWRSLIVCIGQLTVLVGAVTGLVVAIGELGHAAGCW